VNFTHDIPKPEKNTIKHNIIHFAVAHRVHNVKFTMTFYTTYKSMQKIYKKKPTLPKTHTALKTNSSQHKALTRGHKSTYSTKNTKKRKITGKTT
jgi:hypothetical protein